MKILIVTQYFWPENFRINDLCLELIQRGHSVSVLTGKPNYPTGEVFPEFSDNPKKYDIYNGCQITRVPMIARGKSSQLKLIANYVSYVISASVVGGWTLRKEDFDVIFVYEPSPVTVCLPAIFIKKFRKIPIVLWVLDLWPETLEAVGVVKSPKLLRYIGKLVSFIYKHCDLILGQSKAFSEDIAFYAGTYDKVRYFPSWSENMFFQKDVVRDKVLENNKDSFNLLFAGNIGDAQDFPAVLDAFEIIKLSAIRVKLFIVGDGRAFGWLKSEVKVRKLDNLVCLLGRHPLEKMPSFYQAADALLVSLKNSGVFSKTIPAKVQSYMAAGKPIVSMLSGEGARVIVEAKCGYTAESGDSSKLAENILAMAALSDERLSILGENAYNYASHNFNRDKLITQLEEYFHKVSKLP
jgi:glycosyltransferase involved in cell wall biosynthesis